ncbi:MAG: long-chain acyl-CoA synthetase [Myxococcota bacterium]|jgi:long-chain acyl-CoA synthetase
MLLLYHLDATSTIWTSDTVSINVAQILRQAALQTPERVAMTVVDAEGVRADWTCERLDRAARHVAAKIAPGTRVAVQAPNGAAFVAAWFGTLYAGGTVIPIPMELPPAAAAPRLAHADMLLTEALDLEPASKARCLAEPRSTAGDDPAMILFTSGTTANPRGVVIGHSALLLHTTTVVHRTLRLTADDVILGVLPFTHSYGCRMVLLAGLVSGARIVTTPTFSARQSRALMAEEGVTWVPAVPTMFAAWAAVAPSDRSDAPPKTAVRWCLSAGAPLPDAIRLSAERAIGAEIRQGYGMTEATFSTLDAPPHPQRAGSVGRPVWGVEVKLVDDAGSSVPTGERGQILLRGPNQMLGYLDDPDATQATLAATGVSRLQSGNVHAVRGARARRDQESGRFERGGAERAGGLAALGKARSAFPRTLVDGEGWIHSGDIGVLDADGTLTVIDRVKDIILRGGFTVYPSRVEAAVAAFPGVLQAAVVGRPDDFYGEEVVACIIVDPAAPPDHAALDRHLAGILAEAERPHEIVVLDAFPLGPSRKVLKRRLRATVAAAASKRS